MNKLAELNLGEQQAQDRLDLINRVARWCYDNTETWNDERIGVGLAYLLWAIADPREAFEDPGGYYDKLVKVLKSNPNGLYEELIKKGVIVT